MTDPRVERTRTVVHAAVLDLLRSEGPAAVTHQRVAETAGVGRATVYRHWPDRVGLLADTLASRRPTAALPAPTGDLRSDLLELLVAVSAEMEQQHEFPWFVAMVAQADLDPELAVLRERVARLDALPIAPLLERIAEHHGIDVDPRLVAAELIGPLFALRFMFGQRLDRAVVEQHLDLWWRGLGVDR